TELVGADRGWGGTYLALKIAKGTAGIPARADGRAAHLQMEVASGGIHEQWISANIAIDASKSGLAGDRVLYFVDRHSRKASAATKDRVGHGNTAHSPSTGIHPETGAWRPGRSNCRHGIVDKGHPNDGVACAPALTIGNLNRCRTLAAKTV